MTQRFPITEGKAVVTNDSTTVTFIGTNVSQVTRLSILIVRGIAAFVGSDPESSDPDDHPQELELELLQPWPGTSTPDPQEGEDYAIAVSLGGAEILEGFAQLLDRLVNKGMGLAGSGPPDDNDPRFRENDWLFDPASGLIFVKVGGSFEVVSFTLTFHEQGTLAERDAFDDEAAGFTFLDNVSGNLYVKKTGVSGDWAGPFSFVGPRGTPGLRWNFDANTTTNANPGANNVRLNAGSFASVTEISFSNTSIDGAVGAFMSAVGASTNASKGFIVLRRQDAAAFAVYRFTQVNSETGRRRFFVEHVTSNGSPGGVLAATFLMSGDKGDKGDKGDTGDQGNAGWAPELATVEHGSRRVLEVVDWVGGEGTKPTTLGYIGDAGIVQDIEDAINIRGEAGARFQPLHIVPLIADRDDFDEGPVFVELPENSGLFVRVSVLVESDSTNDDLPTLYFLLEAEDGMDPAVWTGGVTFLGGAGGMDPEVYDPQGIEDDAFARANHTGMQSISTVTGLQAALDARALLSGAAFTGSVTFTGGNGAHGLGAVDAPAIDDANDGGSATRFFRPTTTNRPGGVDGTTVLNMRRAASRNAQIGVETDLAPAAAPRVWTRFQGTGGNWSIWHRVLLEGDVKAPTVQVFTSNGTWNKPAGLRAVVVEVVGGGGGGGGSDNADHTGGGGGGGGYATKRIAASALGSSETVTIGPAGSGGGVNAAGTGGGTSSFGSHASATGGSGGNAPGGAGGATPAGTGSGGDLNLTGGEGSPRQTNVRNHGRGGDSPRGYGMSGALNTAASGNGTDATGFGGGGTGGMGASRSGGNGKPGIVIVWEFY